MQRRNFLEALGLALGAAAGSGCAARSANSQLEQINAAQRSAGNQGLLGQEAAGLQAFHAHAQQIAASTCSVNVYYPPQWLANAPVFVQQKIKREIEERVHANKTTQPVDKAYAPMAMDTDNDEATAQTSGDKPAIQRYAPLELETHEDFAAKLAARP